MARFTPCTSRFSPLRFLMESQAGTPSSLLLLPSASGLISSMLNSVGAHRFPPGKGVDRKGDELRIALPDSTRAEPGRIGGQAWIGTHDWLLWVVVNAAAPDRVLNEYGTPVPCGSEKAYQRTIRQCNMKNSTISL
jgi:hypothetical protein